MKSIHPLNFRFIRYKVKHILSPSLDRTKIPSRFHQSICNTTTSDEMVVDGAGADTVLIFTYGTLKQGFSNHCLMQDLIRRGDAAFVARCRTRDRRPLVCGPYRVPFLLDLAGSGERVWGELYEVGREGLARMDELEGTGKGHYERRPVAVVAEGGGDDEGVHLAAEAYFAHSSYAMGLWRKSGEVGYGVYSHKEARGYVKRIDRPRNVTFLQQIDAFIAQSDS